MSKEFPKIENKNEQPFNFEKWLELELPKQYEEKVKILNKLGILEILPEAKEFGIVGIDGKEYPIPEMEEIKDKIEKNKEMFETKMKQGFTDLNIIPFGTELSKLIKIMEKTILKHHKEGKLFTAKKNLEDESEPLQKLELYADCETNPDHSPVDVWKEGYDKADTEGKLVYYPQEFSENHQAKLKERSFRKLKRDLLLLFRKPIPIFRKKTINRK